MVAYENNPFVKRSPLDSYSYLLEQFVKCFIDEVEKNPPLDVVNYIPPPIPPPLPDSYDSSVQTTIQNGEWTYLPKSLKPERAEWLNTKKLEEILQDLMGKSYIGKMTLLVKSKEDQTKLILRFDGDFVAVLDQNQRFEKLIDRQRLANEIAHNLVVD